ncbi:hypothetical protein SLS62_002351 [Diatrype stigma]|uniref:Uncharacterized protein n=1 Tax=Diatrype stigma TaxID=117547 RepID=A0AAN9V911_9PEZI
MMTVDIVVGLENNGAAADGAVRTVGVDETAGGRARLADQDIVLPAGRRLVLVLALTVKEL